MVPGEYRVALNAVHIGRHSVVGPLVHVVPPLGQEISLRRPSPVVPDGCKLSAMSSTDRYNSSVSAAADRKDQQGSFTPLLRYRDQVIGLFFVLLVHSFSLIPSAILVSSGNVMS